MDWVKKNVILLVCGVLALAGISVGVWSLMGFKDIQTKAAEIAGIASQLEGAQGQAANETMIDQAKKYYEQANRDASVALKSSKAVNERTPLRDDVFPVEKKADSGYNFRIDYRREVQKLPELVKGGKAPNANDVERIVNHLLDKSRKEANLVGTGGELKVPKPPQVQPWVFASTLRPTEDRGPGGPGGPGGGGEDPWRRGPGGPGGGGEDPWRRGPGGGGEDPWRRGPSESGTAMPVARPGTAQAQSPQRTADLLRVDARRAAIYQNAKSIWTYLNDDSFEMHPIGLPDSVDKPKIEDLWAAQMFLWIETDIAQALRQANEQAIKNHNLSPEDQWVANLPVKHLVSLRLSDYLTARATASDTPGTRGGSSNSILHRFGAQGATGSIRFGQQGMAFTDRARSSDYDVIHVALNLVVDARDLPMVLLELSKKNFITPLQVQYRSVDVTGATNAGYLYGSGPVVNVDIVCETLFFRSIYDPMMPEIVKDVLEGKVADRGGMMR